MQAKSIDLIIPCYKGDMKVGRPPADCERSEFGIRLQKLREAAGLSQRDVAAKMNISQPSYAAWERRNIGLNIDQLRQLAKTLNVEVEDFFIDEEKVKKRGGSIGRARKSFDALSTLPRNEQQKILDVVDALIAQAS